MIRIWEQVPFYNKGYAFSCTENFITTPYRFFRKKTKTGEYLKRLKYDDDFSVIPLIVNQIYRNRKAREFLTGAVLIAVPPSKKREVQPLEQLAQALSVRFNMTYISDAIPCEVVDTSSSVPEGSSRNRKFVYHFVPDTEKLSDIDRNARIILFDDYYDTGDTMRDVCSAMEELFFCDLNIFTVGYTKAAKRRFKSDWKNF